MGGELSKKSLCSQHNEDQARPHQNHQIPTKEKLQFRGREVKAEKAGERSTYRLEKETDAEIGIGKPPAHILPQANMK